MTGEEKKQNAWEVTVHRANQGNEFFSIYDANAIIAADAEIKRLRERLHGWEDTEQGLVLVANDRFNDLLRKEAELAVLKQDGVHRIAEAMCEKVDQLGWGECSPEERGEYYAKARDVMYHLLKGGG